MRGLDTMKKYVRGGIFFIYVGWRYLKKTSHLVKTKLAKRLCKAFSYGVIPDPFVHLGSSKMDQTKGIDALKK